MSKQSLHAQIMNIPCNVPTELQVSKGDKTAYQIGHRDARHAAAELAQSQSKVLTPIHWSDPEIKEIIDNIDFKQMATADDLFYMIARAMIKEYDKRLTTHQTS